MKKRHEQKLVIVSLALLIMFNLPFILIFDINDAIYGVPVLYFSIFVIWLISILITYIVLKRHYE